MTTARPQERTPRPLGWLVLPVRVALGALFVFAGVMKLQDPQAFAFSIKAFKMLPESGDHLVVLAALALPWAEVLAGAMLVLGLWGRAAALVIFAMLLVFLGGMISVIARGMNVECTCFGKYEFPCSGAIGPCHLVRNGVLAAGALLCVLAGPGPLAIDKESRA